MLNKAALVHPGSVNLFFSRANPIWFPSKLARRGYENLLSHHLSTVPPFIGLFVCLQICFSPPTGKVVEISPFYLPETMSLRQELLSRSLRKLLAGATIIIPLRYDESLCY